MVPSVLHRIVTGKRRCGFDDVVALSIALDVSPNALLCTQARHGATTSSS